MILIGQYDSPFVRRVAVALRLTGHEFEHRPWSVFGDAARIAAFNPLTRVPTLILDDGEVLVDSYSMIDHIDDVSGEGALFPATGTARRRQVKIAALACGVADKAVSLVYETVIHQRGTPVWEARCLSQINGALDLLDQDRAAVDTPWWFGARPGHADIAVGCVARFISESLPGRVGLQHWPALLRHAERCEARPEFLEHQQPFHVTPPKAS